MNSELLFTINDKKQIVTELPAFIVGIMNITPDSFYAGSRTMTGKTDGTDAAVERALKLVEEGADIIDLGAESTRPGSTPISEEEEIERLIPVLKAVRKVTDCPISVDTTKSGVLKAALEAGAGILNDVSALENDKMMVNVCRNAEIPVILTHNHDIMDTDASETLKSVSDYLAARVLYALENGLDCEKLILDAGIGFGKTYEQNLCLIKNSRRLRECVLEKTHLEGDGILPVMMALSRKRCIGAMTGREVDQRLSGTVAANLLAVQEGAVFLRVHDVAETKDMLAVLHAMNKE